MGGNHIRRKAVAISLLFFLGGISIIPMISGVAGEKGVSDISLRKNPFRGDNDTTPPVTTISFEPPVPNGMNGWYVSNVTVLLNATDNESGVYRTYCSLLPPGEFYTEPILLSQDGVYFIYFCSVDYAGNVELPKSVAIKIDKTPPVILLNYSFERVGFMKWIIIVTATCYDAMSGTSGKVEFYFNGVLQETVTGAGPDFVWTFQYVKLPSVTIKVIVWDNAGNIAEAIIINPHSVQYQSQLIPYFLRHQYEL